MEKLWNPSAFSSEVDFDEIKYKFSESEINKFKNKKMSINDYRKIFKKLNLDLDLILKNVDNFDLIEDKSEKLYEIFIDHLPKKHDIDDIKSLKLEFDYLNFLLNNLKPEIHSKEEFEKKLVRKFVKKDQDKWKFEKMKRLAEFKNSILNSEDENDIKILKQNLTNDSTFESGLIKMKLEKENKKIITKLNEKIVNLDEKLSNKENELIKLTEKISSLENTINDIKNNINDSFEKKTTKNSLENVDTLSKIESSSNSKNVDESLNNHYEKYKDLFVETLEKDKKNSDVFNNMSKTPETNEKSLYNKHMEKYKNIIDPTNEENLQTKENNSAIDIPGIKKYNDSFGNELSKEEMVNDIWSSRNGSLSNSFGSPTNFSKNNKKNDKRR